MSGVGALRHRFTHQTAVALPDGVGGIASVYLTLDQLWGALETVSTEPAASEDSRLAVLLHRVTVRAPNTVAPGDRLLLRNRVFAVEAVHDPDGRGRFSRCRCREEMR